MSITDVDGIRPGTYLHFKHLLLKSGFLGFLYFLIPVITIGLSRRRSLEDYAKVDSSNRVKILLILLITSVIFVRLLNSRNFSMFFRGLTTAPLSWFVLYLSWSVISLFWCPTVLYSGWMLVENVVYVSAILLIFIRFGNNIDDCIHFILYYAIFWYVFRFTKLYLLAGVIPTFHNIHGVGAIEVAPLLYLALSYPTRYWIKLFFIAVTFVSTGSSMFLAIAIVEVIACFTARNKIVHILIVLTALTALTAVIASRGKDAERFLFFGKDKSTFQTGSGRNLMYENIYKTAMNRPMTGYGFCSLNTALQRHSGYDNGINIVNAHNFVLEAFISSGAIGALIIIFFFISVIMAAGFRLISTPFFQPLLYSAITVSIVSFLNPSVSGRVYGAWEPTMFVVILTTHVLCLKESQNLLPEESPFF